MNECRKTQLTILEPEIISQPILGLLPGLQPRRQIPNCVFFLRASAGVHPHPEGDKCARLSTTAPPDGRIRTNRRHRSPVDSLTFVNRKIDASRSFHYRFNKQWHLRYGPLTHRLVGGWLVRQAGRWITTSYRKATPYFPYSIKSHSQLKSSSPKNNALLQ